MDEKKLRKIIKNELNSGTSLSNIQRLLDEEYDVNMTYLDLRMIASELNVNWEKQEAKKPVTPSMADETISAEESTEKQQQPSTGTQVTVDKVTRPDALMSGTVKFKSGASGKWFVDHAQQLGLAPDSGSSKPTQEDIIEFQKELQQAVSGG